MTTVGIDLEQFIRDPYGTGIQRVLQQLALNWPSGEIKAEFVVPNRRGSFTLIDRQAAAELLSLPFRERLPGDDLRQDVNDFLEQHEQRASTVQVNLGDLVAIYDAWLLPEVSYLPSVLERLDLFGRCMPTTMIGYDALPQTEPANYRFVPGTAAWVSEYFRRLVAVDSVVCISDYARDEILGRLRRDPSKPITIAHPGGDHLAARAAAQRSVNDKPKFVRLGTMEARKRPIEILRGFEAAVRDGLDAELVFIGSASSSSEAINGEMRAAVASGYPVTWVSGASDAQVHDLVHGADAFLSFGVEGFGIPVLEAIRLGTPVLFDGIQPAGDLMAGRGAKRVPAGSEAQMADLFTNYGKAGGLDGLRGEVDPAIVPSWQDFAARVAGASARI
jgi:glycosyltransferase involved in cell wall biosynthesis